MRRQKLAEEHQRLIDAVHRVDDMCRELAAHGIPETIQHDDLHDGQVFVRDGCYRVFDWGDSSVSHPFHSLTVILRQVAWKLDLEPGGRELQRLRDAYLEPFGDLQSVAELAYRTGTIARSPQALSRRRPDWNVARRLAVNASVAVCGKSDARAHAWRSRQGGAISH